MPGKVWQQLLSLLLSLVYAECLMSTCITFVTLLIINSFTIMIYSIYSSCSINFTDMFYLNGENVLQKQSPGDVLQKRRSGRFRKMHGKTLVSESLFHTVAECRQNFIFAKLQQKLVLQDFSNTVFTEHLQMTVFDDGNQIFVKVNTVSNSLQ